MRVIHHRPWALVDSLRRDAHRVSAPPARSAAPQPDRFLPSADFYEQADRYLIEADLPGIDPSAVNITLDDGILTVSGDRKFAEDAEHGALLRSERPRGSFERRFKLPESAAADGVEASYRDGVLAISIPKLAAAVSRRIEIKAA